MKKVLTKLWLGWKRTALRIARFQTKLLLALFFFLVISPLGGLMKQFGWDPLGQKPKRQNSGSSWQPINDDPGDISKLKRMS